uniref:(California timema) hypothetical protein n=1 Tax=Timema californicum TaxID=61474 RepID=A0A7R9JDR8_TIMCA|nr:unnamed protein product [Timema californicum]
MPGYDQGKSGGKFRNFIDQVEETLSHVFHYKPSFLSNPKAIWHSRPRRGYVVAVVSNLKMGATLLVTLRSEYGPSRARERDNRCLACARVQCPLTCVCGYIPYRLSLQYQSQPPQQQQAPPPPPPAPLQGILKTEPQSPKQLPPVVKLAPPSPVAPAVAQVEEPVSETTMDADENSQEPKPRFKKKFPGYKVNKRVKRRRQNARLRKILQPKNAIMVLNELVSGVKFSFQEHSTALKQTTFIFNAEVNGKMYAGQGLSKLVAKQNAAESALKALLLEKIAQASEASTKMETNELEGGGAAPVEEKKNPPAPGTDNGDTASECEEGSIAEGKPGAPEDEVPWGNLASFALYKLFVEWQQQGTPVPLTKPIAQTVTLGPKSNPPAPMKKIPENPTERHPVMLLNQLRPGVVFNELSRVGTPPDVTFTLEVTVDGTSYTGSGKNKKDAKKEAAKAALSGALSINYSTP